MEQHQQQQTNSTAANQMKNPVQSRGHHSKDEGMAMVITLLMGLILLGGSTGLVARQMMARKVGGSESYQQMAENAALNGFNRILATLNKDNDLAYRGYFLELDNKECDEGDCRLWESANERPSRKPLQELCTNTSIGLPGGAEQNWPLNLVNLTSSGSERNDGKGDIRSFYRLRQYNSPDSSPVGTTGEGKFVIEGIVQRENQIENDDEYLARTLLTRSLYVQSIVAAEDDWAVMAGRHLELGGSTIVDAGNNPDSSGLILLDVDNVTEFQTSGACGKYALASQVDASNIQLGLKVWPTHKRGLPLTSLFEEDKIIDLDSSIGKPRIWSFDDSDRNSSELSAATQNFHNQCPDLVCTRIENSSIFTTPNDIEISREASIIKISGDDICKNQTGLECHIYIEHMNLSKTEVRIENSNRPVVLHLERPIGDDFVSGLSGAIQLSGSSKLCGSDGGLNSCNKQPERFVITASAGQSGMACNSNQHVLSFEGRDLSNSTLPHAMVLLPKGTVRTTAPASLHGVIWAHSICAKNGAINLITEDNRSTVVRAADELWQWSKKGFPGYGRMVTRGVRGTGLDTFQRW